MSKNAATATGDDTADLLLLAPASTESPLGTTTADPYHNTTIDYILSTVATATGISGWRLPAVSDMATFTASADLTVGRGYLYYDSDSALRASTPPAPRDPPPAPPPPAPPLPSAPTSAPWPR